MSVKLGCRIRNFRVRFRFSSVTRKAVSFYTRSHSIINNLIWIVEQHFNPFIHDKKLRKIHLESVVKYRSGSKNFSYDWILPQVLSLCDKKWVSCEEFSVAVPNFWKKSIIVVRVVSVCFPCGFLLKIRLEPISIEIDFRFFKRFYALIKYLFILTYILK